MKKYLLSHWRLVANGLVCLKPRLTSLNWFLSRNSLPNAATASIYFCLGCCLGSQSAVVSQTLVFLALLFCLALAVLSRYFSLLLAPLVVTLGYAWFSAVALSVLQAQLPLVYEKNNFQLVVKVADFPRENTQRSTFLAEVVSVENLSQPQAEPWGAVGRIIRLNCYHCEQSFNLGEYWQLHASLRSMRSLQSWHAVDFERHALLSRVVARGTITESSLKRRQVDDVISPSLNFIASNWLEQSRIQFRQRIISAVSSETAQALMLALAIGDRSQFDHALWQVLTITGLSHLVAISGLHIGLVFFFSRFVIRRLTNVFHPIYLWVPAIYLELVLSLSLATLYAALAGFALSTQRALFMLVIYCCLQCSLKTSSLWSALLLALGGLLLLDPLSVLAGSFWLSVGAVAIIAIGLRLHDLSLSRLQLYLSLGMMPCVLYWIGHVSLLSPFVNLVAVPFVAWFILPCLLLLMLLVVFSVLLSTLLSPLSSHSFSITLVMDDFVALGLVYLGHLIDASWQFLLQVVGWSQGVMVMNVSAASLTWLQQTSLILLVAYVICWRIIPNQRLCGIALCLMAWASWSQCANQTSCHAKINLAQGEFNVVVFDVGQGLAIAIETPIGVTIYDTGNRYLGAESSAIRDSVQQVVLPYLQHRGVDTLERVIISHHDQDHIGGWPSLSASMNVKQLLSSDWIDDVDPVVKPVGSPAGLPIEQAQSLFVKPAQTLCQRGLVWHEQGVSFKLLSPTLSPAIGQHEAPQTSKPFKQRNSLSSNNRSCVLHVSSHWGSVLIPGDIERVAEHALLMQAIQENNQAELAADVLILPHHGSQTSTSPVFLQAVKPSIAIASAGYLSRHGHPHRQVLSRLRRQGVKIFNTAYSGSLKMRFSKQGLETIEYRAKHRRFWYAKHSFY